jgi:UDP-GlcNAc:undecaprenyl-phosphate/decaprenyl-phosphate GlcNAc-1-phosphate transferase
VARDRRRFLDLQMAVTASKDLQGLWESICCAMQELDMDFAELELDAAGAEASGDTALKKEWAQNGFRPDAADSSKMLFKLELPLHADKRHLGKILLIKDLARSPINHYTLTRIEHLRRSISRNLTLQG